MGTKDDHTKDEDAERSVDDQLKRLYGRIAEEPLPADLVDLAGQLDRTLNKRRDDKSDG